MNKFIQAIKDLDFEAVKAILESEPKWLNWSERDGKNALHFLCGVPMFEMRPGIDIDLSVREAAATGAFKEKADTSLQILKFILKRGMDINSVQRVIDNNCDFPATPLWYAYTRGRNEKLYTYLLKQGADPRNCMYAITWYDDTKAAALFKKYGAFGDVEPIDGPTGMDSPLLSAFVWKTWKMAEWLLKNGADPNVRGQRGNTALFYAVRKKYDAVHIKLLIKHGADPDRANNESRTPRGLAASYRDKTILKLFDKPARAANASVNERAYTTLSVHALPHSRFCP